MTDLSQVLEKARDVVTVKQVFGEPQVQDGVTIIPVARVGTGGGGGGGEGSGGEGAGAGTGSGYGLGFGLGAEPVGVYVIKDGVVNWQPAFHAASRSSASGRACRWACAQCRGQNRLRPRARMSDGASVRAARPVMMTAIAIAGPSVR